MNLSIYVICELITKIKYANFDLLCMSFGERFLSMVTD